jgi:hypothetical protein
MENCKNCGHQFDGQFCNLCGQQVFISPFNVKNFLREDVRNDFLGYQSGYLYTFRNLLFRPGHAINEYLLGKRIKYVGPFAFLIGSTALMELIESSSGLNKLYPPAPEFSNVFAKINNFLLNDPKWLFLFTVPIFAWVSSRVFKKTGVAFGDHFQNHMFAIAMTGIIPVLCALPAVLNPSPEYFRSLMTLGTLVALVYYIFLCFQLYRPYIKPSGELLWRSVVCTLLGNVITFMIFIALFVLENVLG